MPARPACWQPLISTIAKGERSVTQETIAEVYAGLRQEMSALERRRGRIANCLRSWRRGDGKEPAVMAGQMPAMRVTMLAIREIAL
ncbi:MAG: hypothetical protein QOF63_3980 [Thermoanaerobaculia bacterium]|nr:hypothetical protein [Thermoanaerobaculia bacterium]